MSLQSQLNKQALKMVPKTYEYLKQNKLSDFSTLQRINNLKKALTAQTESELLKTDLELLEALKEGQ